MSDLKTAMETFTDVLHRMRPNTHLFTTYDMAAAAFSALEEAGFVVVPVEPTKEMHDAGVERDTWIGIYQAMIEARPTASALCHGRRAPSVAARPDDPAPLPPASCA